MMEQMDTKDLLRRMMTVSSWKEGDRVRDRRGRTGTVVLIEGRRGGPTDGVQVVGWRVNGGNEYVVSLGGELEAEDEAG